MYCNCYIPDFGKSISQNSDWFTWILTLVCNSAEQCIYSVFGGIQSAVWEVCATCIKYAVGGPGLRHSGLFCIYRLGGARWLRWPWGEILYLCILYLLYMHSVIFIFVLLQIFIFVFYIITFLTFKAAGRGPKVAARGGKCLLRSRNVAGIEILQSFSSMKWGRMFFYSNVA